MITIESKPLDLPSELQALYEGAKATYNLPNYRESLHINEQLHERSISLESTLGEILGQRFMGLCHYRLGELEASRTHFEAALERAKVVGAVEQQLLLRNHLAATMTGLGLLEIAHEHLKDGLALAPVDQHPHAHARLLGNMGALLDELGQRAAADDCYARFEVLARLLGNKHRLANAVGLAARAAELRGDLATAEEKYSEEAKLAEEVKDPVRAIAATVHQAQLAAGRNDPETAEQGFKAALAAAERHVPNGKRHIDALEAYANFLRARTPPNLPEAHRLLRDALAKSSQREKQANVNHSLALVCRDAGLYGESLFYLMRSAETRASLYAPLRALRNLAQTRLNELQKLTKELLDEAFLVYRSQDVEAKLTALVNQVHADPNAWDNYINSPAHRVGEPPLERSRRLIDSSRATWTERLLPGDFAKFSEHSRDLLERAERSYSSTVDDLGRSAHLLALVVECELRDRIFKQVTVRGIKHWMLGNMLSELRNALSAAPALSSSDRRHRLHAHVRTHRPLVEKISTVSDPIYPLDGTGPLKIVDVRNDVAHGNATTLGSLGRVQVDAIKRHLALEALEGGLTILQALARLPRLD
jgi:tetratricopeptide (TPR) repeat protein